MKKRGWAILWVVVSVAFSIVFVQQTHVRPIGQWIGGELMWLNQGLLYWIFPALVAGMFMLFQVLHGFLRIKSRHRLLMFSVQNHLAFFIIGLQFTLFMYSTGLATSPYVGVSVLVAWIYLVIGNVLPRLDQDYSWPKIAEAMPKQQVKKLTRVVGITFVATSIFLLLIIVIPAQYQALYLTFILVLSGCVKAGLAISNVQNLNVKE